MMKHFIKIMVALAMCACLVPFQSIRAEDEPPLPYDQYLTEWNTYCDYHGDHNDSAACNAYRDYLNQANEDLNNQLSSVEELQKKYEADADAARAQVEAIQTSIDTLQAQISDVQAKIDEIQTQIDAKQVEIDNKEKEIKDTQDKIDTISTKIKQRMVNEQSSLKINKYLDILMGASTIEDWFRILSGLQAISESDKNSNDQLVAMREKMDQQKKELLSAQDELKTSQDEQQTQKNQLDEKKTELVSKQAEAQIAAAAASELAAQQLALGNNISANISSIRDTLQSVALNGDPVPSYGWTWPVPGSYRSAGTWYYYDSSVIHLGNDFAASLGTPVVAAANGLIINSANGCGYGYYGDGCGVAQGGLWGGGNQVYELAVVGDSLYAILYAHLLLNSPIATGTQVNAGDQIGQLGSSGNSTGPHTHVEVTYLGAASDFSSWLASWNGDLGFGCGWAGSYDGFGRRCEAGYSAPCRIRPESVFG